MRVKPTRFLVTTAVLLVSALLLACPVGQLRVLIPDFETSNVRGFEMFRVDDATGALEPAGAIRFRRIENDPNAGEMMIYRQINPDGSRNGIQRTPVVRNPEAPDAIELQVWFVNELPAGWFRAATFNAAGTSPPSTDQRYLRGSTT
jgi:hypothetical protein